MIPTILDGQTMAAWICEAIASGVLLVVAFLLISFVARGRSK